MAFGFGFALTAIAKAVGFTPRSLFTSGEQGVWYDPSDLSTLFQDAAGTTPVTGVGQPVGLILDKSKGLVLGPELVTNGDFSSSTGWALSSGVSISSGVCTFTNVVDAYRGVVSLGLLTAEKRYRLTVDVLSISGGALVGFFAGNISPDITTSGVYTFDVTAGSLTTNFGIIRRVGTVNAVIDNVSVKEVLGNHATQATTTSRPVLSARVNLLTATETLATQTVTTRATTQTLRFEGAGTVTLSGTATGTYSAGSHSVTTTAGNLTLTVSGTVTKADLRATNMGVGLPAYQRVNTATDYDTAGFPMYLSFDGVDDGLVTPSIDFTGTDKVAVWAGVRKLSDAGTGVVAELSSDINTNNQCFTFLAPSIVGSYRFFSRATVFQGAGNGIFAPAPDTSVITGIGDISGDIVSIRRNGSLIATNPFDQGTGNYGNYPLYIGLRGSTAFPFNGNLYGLIVRGAQSTAQQISNTETWVNGKTGAY